MCRALPSLKGFFSKEVCGKKVQGKLPLNLCLETIDMTKEQLWILSAGRHVRSQSTQVNIPLENLNFVI